jgi:type I restriction enzyme S subunit
VTVDNWLWTTLGDVATITAGNPAPQGDYFFERGDRPFVRVQDLGRLSGKAKLAGVADHVNEKAAASLKLFPKGSVLFTKSGASLLLNQRAILGRDMHVVSHIGVAIPGPRVKSEWLYYWLRTVDFADIAHGANMPSLPLSRVKDIRIPVPPLTEQSARIAEIEKQFSRLDEAVANLKRVKANLERYKVAILDIAVWGCLGRSQNLDIVDDLPADWRWTTVGELASVGTGATPTRSNEAFYSGGAIPWVTSAAVNRPFVDVASEFVTDEALEQTNLTLYPPGTLLVAMYGEGKTRGKCSELCIAATTNQALAALRVDASIRPWLKLFLNHNYNNTRRIASGGVQPNLNLKLIRGIRLPLPPENQRRWIVAEVDRRLSVVRETETEVEANLKRAEVLRQSILHRAFAHAH